MPSGHPPPAMAANQLTSISQTGTSMAGGVTVMPGQVVPTHPGNAGTPAVASVGNMMSLPMSSSTSMANSTPYQFPIVFILV